MEVYEMKSMYSESDMNINTHAAKIIQNTIQYNTIQYNTIQTFV
jgi:hypothetical protein